MNNSVVIPLTAMPFLAQPELSDIILKLNPKVDLDQVKSKITKYFSEKLPKYQVNIQTARELLKSMSAQQNIFTLLLGAVGSISLFVGGIGIMNVMLAAIAERKEEIGLRLAIGAQPKDIRRMFLTEAALLACIGGGAGVLLGVIGTYIISLIADWDFVFLIIPPVLGFTVTVLICIFFGFYPAYKASKLDPIVALRNE
jgi:putative ABC transport system permease protein